MRYCHENIAADALSWIANSDLIVAQKGVKEVRIQ